MYCYSFTSSGHSFHAHDKVKLLLIGGLLSTNSEINADKLQATLYFFTKHLYLFLNIILRKTVVHTFFLQINPKKQATQHLLRGSLLGELTRAR